MNPETLPGFWRGKAADLRRYGGVLQAELLEACAEDLERSFREHALEALSLEEAVEESGYSRSAIEKKLKRQEMPNVGVTRAPLIPRWALPRKAGMNLKHEDRSARPRRRRALEREANTRGEPDMDALAGRVMLARERKNPS